VMAIGSIDGKVVGGGKTGPVTKRLQEAFLELKRAVE